jgi:hypothetical protein
MGVINLNLGEQVAVEFFVKYGLRCERFTEQERRQRKTPDFRVFNEAEFVLYSEAKHIQEDTWLDDQMATAPAGVPVGGLRPDPIFNRISNHIHEAAKQFLAVNPDHEYPNVLVFTNSDHLCTLKDLVSVFTGNFYADSGAVDYIYGHFSDGRIREEKYLIDVYVWRDDEPKALDKIRLVKSSKYFNALCTLFGVDSSKI